MRSKLMATDRLLPMTMMWLLAFAAPAALAGPPELQTPTPVIYLADNLDEQDKLGWCIDTVGRGLSDRLHAHSCKPQGGDVQFTYDKPSKQIRSATYSGKCAALSAPAAIGVSLGLIDCSDTSAGQRFEYRPETSEFRPITNVDLCLVVGASSRSAGPFMSRGLHLAPCASTDGKFRTWRIKGGGS